MTENLKLEKTLWQAADKLRNNMDAAEYKHVVLGLIFLKYISDAFDELYEKLEASKHETGADPEDKDIAGFCKSANIQDIRKNNYILTPGRYIDFKEVEDDGQAFDEKMQQLTATLSEQMQKANKLDEAIKVNLKIIGYTIWK